MTIDSQLKEPAASPFTKEQEAALRAIPVDDARRALEAEGVALHPPVKRAKGKDGVAMMVPAKSRTAIDVCVYEAGLDYRESLCRLAALFPDALENPVQAKPATSKPGQKSSRMSPECEAAILCAKSLAEAAGKPFRTYEYGKTGYAIMRDMFEWFKGLRLESVDIHSQVSREAIQRAILDGRREPPKLNTKGSDIYELFRYAPVMMAVNAAGSPDAVTGVFCGPNWPEGKIGIVINRPDPDFVAQCPPTAIADTGGGGWQAYYVIERKYGEPAFYDFATETLNAHHGKPTKNRGTLNRAGLDIRVGGFFNREDAPQDGRYARCLLREASGEYPAAFEKLVDEMRPIWESMQWPAAEIPEIPPMPDALDLGGSDFGPASRESFRLNAESAFRNGGGSSRGLNAACALLKRVAPPDYQIETAEGMKRLWRKKWEADPEGMAESTGRDHPDRSRMDARIAAMLYRIGATPHEVYSCLLEHAAKDDNPDQDRYARRTALNIAPAAWFSKDARSDAPEYRGGSYYDRAVPANDPEYRRRMNILYPPRRRKSAAMRP